jgi:hypothetical protein
VEEEGWERSRQTEQNLQEEGKGKEGEGLRRKKRRKEKSEEGEIRERGKQRKKQLEEGED